MRRAVVDDDQFDRPVRLRDHRLDSTAQHRIHLWGSLVLVWRERDVLYALAQRAIRARYKRLFLGPAWVLLTPLAYVLVFSVLFGRVVKVDTGGVPYALFSYTALVPWG